MKNKETIADILFAETPYTDARRANIMVSVGNPNPFQTGQWICPICHYKFLIPVSIEPEIVICPLCSNPVSLDLNNLYQEDELLQYLHGHLQNVMPDDSRYE